MAGRFQERITWRERGLRDVLRIYATGGFGSRDAPGVAARVPRAPRAATLAPPERGTAVTWVGHATCLVQLGGRSILTDPVWATRLPGLIPRLTAPGVAWEALPLVDAVVISHDHLDHLHAGTIRRLPRATPVFAPLGVADWFRRRGFTRVHGLDWWQEAGIDGVTATCVPVQHWCQRGVWDRNRRLWAGWHLAARDAPSVLFAGDTGYFPGFREIGRRLRSDVAILPVGAYEPRWFMQPMHMNPEEAVTACSDLGARHMVPMHWGTFALSREPFLEPLERARSAWHDGGLEPESLWDLALGERRVARR